MAVTNDVRNRLKSSIKSGWNWRLSGLYLAHPDVPSGFSEKEVARAWPSQKSDYRMLGAADRQDSLGAADKKYSVYEDSEEYRQLSDATKKGDWNEGPFEEQVIHSDRAIKRALAFEDSIANLDVLFRQELLETVIEGARQAQIARDAASVIPVDRDQGNHPRGPDDDFAPEVAEGGAIEDDAGEHDTVSWDTIKNGQGAAATDKLLNQANVDLIAKNVEHLGRAAENAVNRRWLTQMVDNAGVTVDAAGEDNRGVASINEAIHQIELNNFEPDAAAMHPTFTKTLFDTAESNAIIPRANEFGDDEGIRNRVAFPLLGIEGFRGSGNTYDPDGSGTWDYTGTDETGAVVYDSDRVNIYMFRDVEIKEYEDPIRDLEGVNVRVEHDTTLAQPDAVANIDHSTS